MSTRFQLPLTMVALPALPPPRYTGSTRLPVRHQQRGQLCRRQRRLRMQSTPRYGEGSPCLHDEDESR